MNKKQLIEVLQEDLKNERKHLMFYTQAAVLVSGLHREELREFFMEEAKGELAHIEQFSELIVHLGDVPGTEVNPLPNRLVGNVGDPMSLLIEVIKMEDEVANNYTKRLQATHEMENSETAYVHVFYEDQIRDSWRTAREVEMMTKSMSAYNFDGNLED